MAYSTREQWLNEGLILLRKEVFIPAGHKPPSNIMVSCEFPSVGAFATSKQRVGE